MKYRTQKLFWNPSEATLDVNSQPRGATDIEPSSPPSCALPGASPQKHWGCGVAGIMGPLLYLLTGLLRPHNPPPSASPRERLGISATQKLQLAGLLPKPAEPGASPVTCALTASPVPESPRKTLLPTTSPHLVPFTGCLCAAWPVASPRSNL